jgi:hypothetical protein
MQLLNSGAEGGGGRRDRRVEEAVGLVDAQITGVRACAMFWAGITG